MLFILVATLGQHALSTCLCSKSSWPSSLFLNSVAGSSPYLLTACVPSFSILFFLLSFSLKVSMSSSTISARFPNPPPKLSILFPFRLWSGRPGAKPQPQDGGTSLSFQQRCVLTCCVLWQSSCLCLFSPCSSWSWQSQGNSRKTWLTTLWKEYPLPLVTQHYYPQRGLNPWMHA